MSTNSLNSLAADLAAFDNYQFALDSMDYMPTEQDYQDWMQCLQEEVIAQSSVSAWEEYCTIRTTHENKERTELMMGSPGYCWASLNTAWTHEDKAAFNVYCNQHLGDAPEFLANEFRRNYLGDNW